PIPLPSGGDGNGQTYVTNKQFASGVTFVQSSRALLEARFGWSSTVAGKNPLALGAASALETYGIGGLPTDSRIAGGLPSQLITGYSNLGRQATNPQWQYPTVYNPKLNYTWVAGRQSLKAGYEFQRILTEVQDVNPLYGRDQYAGSFTRPAGAAANNLYNLADFMLGLRSTYALSNVLVAHLQQNMHFTYLQDDIRVNDRLTLNLGLRYEYASPWTERDNNMSNFDPATLRMVRASDGDRALVDPDRNNVGPRLGLAWTVRPGTVVRGGYGVSYVHFQRAGGGNILAINGPQVINAVVVQSNPTDATFRTTQQGYPAGLTDPSQFNPLAANITYIPRDYHSSQVQSWFASMQREFGGRLLVDVAYVANRADGLLLFANYNQAAPNDATGSLSLQARRPIPQYADITYAFNGGLSRYRAFQGNVDWKAGRGLSVLSSLTLSETKDNGSGSLENPNGNFPAPQDFRNLKADVGLSGYHQPYNSTTSVIWDTPFRNPVLGGWQVAAINTITAGEPVTLTYTPGTAFIVSGIQQDFRGANNYRPNVVGDPLAPADQRTIQNWFNKSAVVIPTDPSQPFGNAARNSVRGPMFWQVDLALSRRVPAGRLGAV
ncbi:MAG: TonB-dependent receptor, partial [Vicinamibacterales bacterium]